MALFAVFELFEAVLIEIPLFDLVLATTICRTFHDTISSSTKLRNRLTSEHIPLFVPFCAGEAETEDICNVDNTSPWFFRTLVDHGTVLILRTRDANIHLYIPDDSKKRICKTDGSRTKVLPSILQRDGGRLSLT